MSGTRRTHVWYWMLLLPAALAWAQEPVANFNGDGSLAVTGIGGKTNSAVVSRGAPEGLSYLPHKQNKGVYLPEKMALSIPVEAFNPREGTIGFWFRPDWSPGDCTPHPIIEIRAQPAFTLTFRKGFSASIAPDYCYLDASPAGSCSFESRGLFTGRTWRHYAIRWSADRDQIQVVVDGETTGDSGHRRMGRFNRTETAGAIPAAVVLNGNACGAFADVRVFDKYLSVAEIVRTAGLTSVARHLQDQTPPPGGEDRDRLDEAVGTVSYVDPVTGKKVSVPGAAEDGSQDPTKHATQKSMYNPAQMKALPETPHTRWARPLVGGPLRVIMIMPVGFYNEASMQREGVELWQRLDCKCEMTDRLTPAMQAGEYDAILLTQMGNRSGGAAKKGWSGLDADLRGWIVERVTSGRSGLVYAYPDKLDAQAAAMFAPDTRIASEVLLRGFPAPFMHRADNSTLNKGYEKCFELDETFFEAPKRLAEEVIEVYRGEKVRAVKLNYKMAPWSATMGVTPDTALNAAATDAHYDYWQALLARAALFAARREAQVCIRSVDLAGDNWSVTLTNAPRKGRIWYRARDAWDRIYAQGEVALTGERTAIAGCALPPRTPVDVIVKDAKGRALDWYVACTPPADAVKIVGIALDKETYARGETVSGKLTVAADKPGDCTLAAYLGDHEGRRLVGRKTPCTLAPGTNTLAFALTIPESSDTLLMRVDALLEAGGRVLDLRSADCPVPRESFEGFYAQLYGSGHNRLSNRKSRERFRDEFGVNGGMHSGAHTYGVAPKRNYRTVEYTTHLGYVNDEKSLAAFMEDWSAFFPKKGWCDLNEVRKHRPVFYSLGEEHYFMMHGSTNPAVVALFQDYLKDKYDGDLMKLNEVWGTNYSSWSEVRMGAPEITDMHKFKPDILKFEESRFAEKLFADKHAYLAGVIRKVDPLAEVGIHASWDTWMGRGYDYWLLSRGMEAIACYGGVQNQYARSFFKSYYGCNYHYAVGCHEDVRWHPWFLLASGARGLSWYTLSSQYWGATASDLSLSGDWEASYSEFAAVRRIGDLLARTEYLQDQVAVHYSSDSLWRGVLGMSWIHNQYINLFFDGGVPFRFVSYEQLGDGELTKQKYPLFVMAHSVSLSEKEATAVRDYLNQGGVVWADIVPGEYDNFGRKLEKSQLADVFANLHETVLPGGKTLNVGSCGRGTVVLGKIGNYPYDRNVGNHLPAQELLDKMVDLAKVERAARVVDRKTGKLANGVWTAGHRQGRQRYVVAAKDYQLADQTKADAEIELGRKGHVYDMREGRYLGQAETVRAVLEPTYGKVFAVLPYRVRKLRAEMEGHAERGGDLVLKVGLVADGEIQPEEKHYLHVSVTGPDGQEVKALRRFAGVSAGEGEIRLPIACDDPAGRWTVILQDAATGVEMEKSFKIVP